MVVKYNPKYAEAPISIEFPARTIYILTMPHVVVRCHQSLAPHILIKELHHACHKDQSARFNTCAKNMEKVSLPDSLSLNRVDHCRSLSPTGILDLDRPIQHSSPDSYVFTILICPHNPKSPGKPQSIVN